MRGALLGLVVMAAPAGAEDPDYSHHRQFGVSARLSSGIRGIATYDDEYCGDTDSSRPNGFAKVCSGRSPLAFDFEVTYGVKRAVDLLLELRIGLEQDFGPNPVSDEGPHPLHLSPGARFYFSEEGRAKIFTTAQLVIDFSAYEDAAGKSLGTDFGVRNMTGLQFDLAKSYGFYVFIGETATFARWFRFEFEGGAGIQGRYP